MPQLPGAGHHRDRDGSNQLLLGEQPDGDAHGNGSGPTNNDTVSFGGFSIQLQIPSASPLCTYGLDPAGQGFGAAGGTATINISTAPNCAWSLFDIPSWVMPTTATTGTGSGSVSFQVLANTGGDRTATMSVTDVPFDVEQEAASIPGLNFIGSMAHLAAQENWTTTFTLVNKGAVSATARLSFFGDATVSLPATVRCAAAGVSAAASGVSRPLLAASFDRTLAANASLIVDTAGPQTSAGAGRFGATGGHRRSGWLRHFPPDCDHAGSGGADGNAQCEFLPAGFRQHQRPGAGRGGGERFGANAVIPVVIRDDTGVVISSPPEPASRWRQRPHFVRVVRSSPGFPVTANIRGTIEFDTPAGGQISVLGLRFTPPNNALTTIPALANVGTGGGSIAHLASGGDGWQTTFVLVNTGTSAAQVTLSFFADQTGAPHAAAAVVSAARRRHDHHGFLRHPNAAGRSDAGDREQRGAQICSPARRNSLPPETSAAS